MDAAYLKPLLDWIADHPAWSSVIVALIAFSESLAVVGLFVPGVVLLFGVGALVAVGSLDLWLTLGAAALGAILGDVISFWLGRYFKEQLRSIWPFRRHPRLIGRGEEFFHRHGGKSVLFGRFVGPIRPVVPAIAGMLGMPALRFIIIDVLSAAAWAPAYIFPGVVFAASLGLAAAVATRLAVLLLLLLVLVWLIVWLVRHVVSFLQPRASQMVDMILNWTRSHRYLGGMAAAVLDPYQSETRGLLLFALLLIALATGLLGLMGGIFSTADIDLAIFNLMRELSTPLSDRLMAVLGRLGGTVVNAAIVASVMLLWAWQRNWPAITHWLTAMAFGVVLLVIDGALPGTWHAPVFTPVRADNSTVSAHPVMVTMIYGFLSVVVAKELSSTWRWLAYLVASGGVIAVSLSHLYFGLVTFSTLAVLLVIALLWMVVIGVAYRRHVPPRLEVPGTVGVAVMMLGVIGMWNVTRSDGLPQPVETAGAPQEMSAEAWWQGRWRSLPSHRQDFLGQLKEPFNLQWLGDGKQLLAYLQARGWSTPRRLTPADILLWLQPDPDISQLPVLPQVHVGKYERFQLVHPGDDAGRQLVMRLWQANTEVAGVPPATVLWVGYVAYQQVDRPLIFLSLPLPGDDFVRPLQHMKDLVRGLTRRSVHRGVAAASDDAAVQWDGEVLLVRQAALPEGGHR